MRQFFLQMAGESGAGKSTLALAVGNATGAVVLDKDVVGAALCQKEGLTAPQAGGYAYAILFPLAESVLNQGFSVILDSAAFWPSIPQRGHELASRCGAEYRIIECRCGDLDEQELRLISRLRHVTQPRSRAELATSLSRPGVMLALDEPHLVVDTTLPLETCVEQVVESLRS